MKAKKEAQGGKENRHDNSGPSDLLAAEEEEDVIF